MPDHSSLARIVEELAALVASLPVDKVVTSRDETTAAIDQVTETMGAVAAADRITEPLDCARERLSAAYAALAEAQYRIADYIRAIGGDPGGAVEPLPPLPSPCTERAVSTCGWEWAETLVVCPPAADISVKPVGDRLREAIATCDKLADVAHALERLETQSKQQLGGAVGLAMDASPLDRLSPVAAQTVQHLVERGILPLDQPVRDMVRVLRIVGIAVCLVGDRPLERCRCLRDLTNHLIREYLPTVLQPDPESHTAASGNQ